MAAMIASIDRADAAIQAAAAPLTGDTTIEQANAALNIQITALTLQIQQLDNEIASGINSGATDEELQAKRDQQTALQAQLTTATANRDALTGYSDMVNTLSTTRTALQNATVLLNARKDAEVQPEQQHRGTAQDAAIHHLHA